MSGREPRKRRARAKGPEQRGHRSRGRRIAGWIAVITTILVTGTSLAAYAQYLGTLHSIVTFDPQSTLGNHRPPAYDGALNLLVVGSDSRAGSNRRFGSNIQGQRSDTMMIVHIRPQHRGVVVVSLPRDTEVPILACKPDGLGDSGQPSQPGVEMLNATFAYGGPPCLWRTVEEQTGIHIDHYLGLTFTGFQQLIDNIGGVNVCLPRAIKDPKSGLNLSAGKHHVYGPQALAFWRERYVGLGSDLQRIQRQQFLMAGLMQEVRSGTLLNNYGRMYSVVRDAAKALTTDRGLSLTDMISLALDLKGLTNRSVQFITAPNAADPSDANRVIWQEPQAGELFHAIAHDTVLPRMRRAPARTRPPATTRPGDVRVDVLNGNGLQGAAGHAATELTGRGFVVTGSSNASSSTYTSSVIQYSSNAEMPAVNTLKAAVGGPVQVQRAPGLTPGTLVLIIGSSFNGLTSSGPSSSSHRTPARVLGAGYGGINAGTNICSDRSAFNGPDNPNQGT